MEAVIKTVFSFLCRILGGRGIGASIVLLLLLRVGYSTYRRSVVLSCWLVTKYFVKNNNILMKRDVSLLSHCARSVRLVSGAVGERTKNVHSLSPAYTFTVI